ncbi:MAG TPA: hypothetical protein VKY85_00750 [Candidatus Angelobacter sp.]|nr:hypothetical protein [Candidatus Angelobacter sp.]
MSELYHLWVQNQDGEEYCDNVFLEDDTAAEEIRERLDHDDRVADYTLEREKPTSVLTADEVLEDLEPLLLGSLV